MNMKIIRVLLLMLVSCSSFAETPDFYQAISDTAWCNDFYLCIPYYQQNHKKLLVITYGALREAYSSHGIDEGKFHKYIKNKIINGDTVNIDGLHIAEHNKIDFNVADSLFRQQSVDSVLYKYYGYMGMDMGNNLTRYKEDKFNFTLEYSLIFYLYKHKIISIEVNIEVENIRLYLGCSPYRNLQKSFADEYSSGLPCDGYYICLPFFDGQEKKILVDLYGHVESYFAQFGFSQSEFKKFVANVIEKGVRIDDRYLPKNACMVLSKEIADNPLSGKTTEELLQMYYNSRTEHHFPPYGNERNTWVYTLFKRGILAYELCDDGVIGLVRNHEIK